MAKQKKKSEVIKEQVEQQPVEVKAPVVESKKFSFDNFQIQSLFLIILGFVLYSNSIQNEYALDDGIVIQKNEYVQEGFTGIGTILTTDAYDSFYKQMGAGQQLAGGRYRPLSIVTFAMEESLFGDTDDKTKWTREELTDELQLRDIPFAKNAHNNDFIKKLEEDDSLQLAPLRHFFNVFFYILSVVVMLYFLRNFIFTKQPIIAFIACLLFLIHPIHTEVVANVKSRDEILSILFIVLTFISVFQYRETKQIKHLLVGLFLYFCSLLSKEYAVTLVVLIPMLLYIIKGDTLSESIKFTIPFILIAFLYMYIRIQIVGTGTSGESPDVLNAPFKFTTGHERIATKIEILNHYLRLLFYPDPLSSDYSYNTISYKNFGDWKVWLSIVIHVSMILATIKLFFKRNILAFAFAFYLGNLALIGNILMEIGATMGERLVYHSSVGFVIAIAIGAHWAFDKLKQPMVKNIVAIAVGGLITLWCTTKVIARNYEWKNDVSLFMADVETVPNSVLVNGNVGKAYYDMSELPENKANPEKEKELLNKGIKHLNKAVSLHKRYVNGYINLGVAYYKLKDYKKAKENWMIVRLLYPNNPYLLNNFKALGEIFSRQAGKIFTSKNQTREDFLKAIDLMEDAVDVAPEVSNYGCDLGGLYYTLGDFNKAKATWQNVLRRDPDHEKTRQWMQQLNQIQK